MTMKRGELEELQYMLVGSWRDPLRDFTQEDQRLWDRWAPIDIPLVLFNEVMKLRATLERITAAGGASPGDKKHLWAAEALKLEE